MRRLEGFQLPDREEVGMTYEVYWIDQDGHAMRSEEKTKKLVVGKVKMLLDLNLAHPKDGIMIEIGIKEADSHGHPD